jgi:methionyl-tRNA formyltransferase
MGTAEFAVPALQALVKAGHEIRAVYTQPPRPAGRGGKVRRTPIHEAAAQLGLAVETPATLRDPAVQERFQSWDVDLAVVAAYGLLLPPAILAAPRCGCVNLHGSLLPRWRGAAPVERAILAGDTVTGVSIFLMDKGLDTGPLLAVRSVPIELDDTATSLRARLGTLAAEMLPAVVADLLNGRARPTPQPSEGVTLAPKLRPEEGRIDFRAPAVEIGRRLRALNPNPGCWCELRGERLILLAGEPTAGCGKPGTVVALPLTVACSEGAIRLTQVQRPGRRPMDAASFVRGFPLQPGDRLG